MAKLGENVPSIVWGNKSFPVTQEFGTYNQATAWMYDYASDVGHPAGTHVGLDVGVPLGTNIYAAESGKVERAGFSDSFRPFPIDIRERDGDLAIYGHLSENFVKTGDTVARGELIGKSGEQTKLGTTIPDGSGPHIHFELRNATNKAIDPDSELRGLGSLSGSTLGSLSESFSSTYSLTLVTSIIIVSSSIAAILFGIRMLRG